ncbi:MATE family efflux transporter [Azospirillum sp. TSO22-1]|uniref:MATE family efflux transporter n=1 Tax=Azospirillum sp. TSO22-1 TaxID=716789 RepID=UPI000D620548|nr:MATE family efflux transporter [Azospirillum sp. TSO22-1]PWC55538.1 multidrug transporter [Azospirillum sp. TSO22-1]
MTADAIERPATLTGRLRGHTAELLRLAGPVIVSRAGLMVMMAVDTAIVGRFSAEQLAFFGLAHLPSNMMIGVGVGLLMGTVAMVAHALGADRQEECGLVWRRSVPYALLMGGLMALAAALLGGPLFRMTGQEPHVAEGGARVLAVLGLGMPGMMLYTTTGFFLEGLKRPVPVMLAMVAGNLVNLGLAYGLVWGAWGLPSLGALGSAWATTLIRWAMGLGLVAYVWWMRDHARWGVRGGWAGWWSGAVRQRALGYAAGLSIGVESASFAALGLLAGLISPLALGAYTVALNLIALPFMAAVGLASATAVRVAVALGRGDRLDMALAGWSGLAVTSVFLTLVGVVYAVIPGPVAGIYSNDPALLERVVPLIAFSAWILVADGGQVVMANALRGRHDAWVPTMLHFVSYAVVMLPAAALSAFALGREEQGLFDGILIASVVSVSILSLRFANLSRR